MSAVTRLRSTTDHPAPPAAVSGALRSVPRLQESVARAGHRATVPGRTDGLLVAGDEVHFTLDVLGVAVEVVVRVDRSDAREQVSTLLRGPRPFPAGSMGLDHRTTVVPTAAGCRASDDVTWRSPLGPLGAAADVLALRRVGRAVLAERTRAVAASATRLTTAGVVAAGAVLDDGRLLVARRTWPAEHAGSWELPGGGVDPGETAGQAVARELVEELELEVAVGEQVGSDVPLADGRVLRAHLARLVGGAAELREHSELRWVGRRELAGLDLLDADRGWVPDLAPLLRP